MTQTGGRQHCKRSIPKECGSKRTGFPDFSPYAKAAVSIDGLNGVMDHDERLANRQVGFKATPKGYTWHHLHDGTSMFLIPFDLHQAVAHTGGRGVLKHLGLFNLRGKQ